MNVLVIGGTRRSGPHLLRALARAGYRVTCLHRGTHRAPLPPQVREVLADRRDPAAFAAAVEPLEVETVVDMIAINDTDVESVMRHLGGRIAHYVVISSYDVYAAYEAAWFHRPYPHPLPIAEDAPPATVRHLYGREAGYDKVLVEEAARRAAASCGVRLTILRYPALYGPGDTTPREWYYVRQVLDRRPVVIAPNGGQALFSRGYLENMAHAVALAVEAPPVHERVCNAADTGQFTVRQIIDAVAAILDHRWEVIDLPEGLLPPHRPSQALPYCIDPYHIQPHLLLDTTRLRAELGYTDVVSPEAALEATVRWLAGRPDAVRAAAPLDYAAIDAAVAAARRGA
ncbi:MAG: NAD-dependent epimerase/dehydratase family protein [Armatimonadota bacterium]|nr:NAD-dependent epimerase/dehydratase family protein [Armatimonadota bacterium]MDR7469180.1 NAD-dependent epimerase/dehydratase family protein [Armatimonadota bacterium]MDR7474549.1 NAD-dependent epimerase/dehydratase family protein [Armatimonadota bacterium]MDR7538693.1 NAD-dependent epimerase/dehydratase family protein [Armatimonadota bacterium]